MTVTLTLCDKCGAVIPDGTLPFKMRLVDREYDLCPECYGALTGDLQSQGRPVPAPAAPVITLPAIFTDPPAPLPGVYPYQPKSFPSGTTGGDWQQQPGVTWTLTGVSSNALTPTLSPTLSKALSSAAASIGTALAASNAAFFPAKD